ncbi:MAG: CinA family protein [Aquificaceae bacterium]
MKVGLCHQLDDYQGFIVRTIGLEEVEEYPHRRWVGGIDLFLESQEQVQEALFKYGKYVYAIGREDMEEVVGRLLRDRGIRLSTAESCTGGLLSARIINTPGASGYFVGGFVVYANELKTKLLSVEEMAIRKYGSVSEEVCRQMAVGALEETDADIALAITGISGPEGATSEKPIGLTYIALATDKEVLVRRFIFKASRNENRFVATQWALEILRRYLLLGGIDV